MKYSLKKNTYIYIHYNVIKIEKDIRLISSKKFLKKATTIVDKNQTIFESEITNKETHGLSKSLENFVEISSRETTTLFDTPKIYNGINRAVKGEGSKGRD